MLGGPFQLNLFSPPVVRERALEIVEPRLSNDGPPRVPSVVVPRSLPRALRDFFAEPRPDLGAHFLIDEADGGPLVREQIAESSDSAEVLLQLSQPRHI